MKHIKIGLLLLFIGMAVGMEFEYIPTEHKIIMLGAMFVIGSMLIGGVLVAMVMDCWDDIEKDRRHGP